jgi:hypothetical protein
MSSVRQQIVDAVKTRLNAVVKNGKVTVNNVEHTYSFTPGTVDVWRDTPLGDEELPAINLRDGAAETGGEAEIGRLEHLLPLAITIAMAGDSSPDTVRAAALDVVKALGSNYTLSGLLHRLRLTAHEIDVDRQNKRLAVATVNFIAHYRTLPYSL